MNLKCVILVLLSSIVIKAKYICNTTEECKYCYPSYVQSYDYECAIKNFHLKTRINEKVTIDCMDLDGMFIIDTSSEIFSLNIGPIKELEIMECSFPKNFFNFMEQLGIESTKELKFEYSEDLQDGKLTSDYFKGINKLKKLSLEKNSIKYIDEDAFQDLEELDWISLAVNELQVVPNIFKYSTKLQHINLSRNKLESISSTLFQTLPNLVNLYLTSNNLRNISGHALKGLKSLELLDLSYNKITSISNEDLNGLSNLKKISVQYNNLKNINENIFENQKNLEIVRLTKNPLTTLPSKIFANLRNLKEVYLDYCNLLELPAGLFENSHSVQIVHIQRNNISILPDTIFNSLGNLQKLDLSFNKLSYLSDGILKYQTKLKVLNLNNNNLKTLVGFSEDGSLGELFKPNFMLEKIDLSYNNLTYFTCDWILNKANLKKLDLNNNFITNFHVKNFQYLSQRLDVNLRNNTISRITAKPEDFEQDLEGINSNVFFYLESNPINCDCKFSDFIRLYAMSSPLQITLPDVNTLKCASPKSLDGFPASVNNTDRMKCSFDELKLEMCSKVCDCSYRSSDKSIQVNCKNMNLTRIPKISLPLKSNLYSNIEVDLSNNLLTSGPNENMGFENVTKLILSSNRISQFNWIPSKLRVLALDRNNISHLNTDVINMLNSSKLTNISLGNNPWICDCLALELFTYLIWQMQNIQIDTYNITCHQNSELILQLTTDQLCPISESEIYIISAICILIILCGITLVIVCNRNRKAIMVWLIHHHFCCGCLSEEDLDKDRIYDVFISYSHKDEDFVIKKINAVLESGPNPYKMCLHIRDWIPGEAISQQIVNSVKQSKRTLIILSPHFLESVWGNMEFQIAHSEAMKEGRSRIILVLYGDVDVNTDLNEEYKAYIKSNTYVKWGDPWFWKKLRDALPQPKMNKETSYKHKNIMLTINDKLDLIDKVPASPNGTTPPILTLDPDLLKKDPLMLHQLK